MRGTLFPTPKGIAACVNETPHEYRGYDQLRRLLQHTRDNGEISSEGSDIKLAILPLFREDKG
jgi:hypothetical protein